METRRLETLFAKALGMEPGLGREAFLEDACRGEPDLRRSVDALLVAHGAAVGFLETRDDGSVGLNEGRATAGAAVARASAFLRELSEGKVAPAHTVVGGLTEAVRREVFERIEAGLRARGLGGKGQSATEPGAKEDWPKIPGFRLEGRLGGGGLGVVYAAFDEKLGRRVAVKVLRSRTDEGVRRRILEEARKAAALEHPAVVTIFSVLDDADPPAIVMERVDGFALDRFGERLSYEQRAGLLRDVARGLAAAHARGVIHRDLKPENVIVGPEMRPRILDFGLALTLDEAAASGRGFEGTPLYASPEQVRGQPLTSASDVFSFGSLMFKVLTGRAPFGGSSPGEVLEAIATTSPPFLRDVAVGVPEDLQAIALACLAWDPGSRPTAETLVVELGRYLSGEPVRLRPRLYEDLLRQRVSEHAQDVVTWEAQGIVSKDERDQLQVLHRRLLADEDHWIIDARRLTSMQTALYTSTWMVVVASVLWVWRARDDGVGPWGWVMPVVATGILLGAGGYAERRRENLAAASFLAAGALSLAPALLALFNPWGWWGIAPAGVTQFLGTAFTNQQCFVACLGALSVSAWALRRLQMTGFAWTTAALAVATYGFGWMIFGWLDWTPYRQGLACLPMVGCVGVALGFEGVGRVRWSLPFHLIALVALLGSLDVMAYDGPTLAALGVPSGSYFTEDRLRAFSFAGNGLLFLGLMVVAERSKSLDLRRAARVLEVVALLHAEGALYANAQANREHPQVGTDVALYLGLAAGFLVLGAWRGRWRLLVGALVALALGSYLLVDLGLIRRVPFILFLGMAGMATALGVFAYLLRLSGGRSGRSDR